MKFKGHTSKDKTKQHQDKGNIECRKDNGIKERKGAEQHAAEDDKPGLVAVPDGMDGLHHFIFFLLAPGKKRQHADAEIRPISQGIVEQKKTN